MSPSGKPIVEVLPLFKALQETGVPAYATAGAAAVDLQVSECCKIKPGHTLKVRTQVCIAMPEGICALILPRSGLGSAGLILANSVGLIDPDYRGEILVALYNRSDKPFNLKEGERIAQMVFMPFLRPELVVVKKFTEQTERGAGGFGSTGS